MKKKNRSKSHSLSFMFFESKLFLNKNLLFSPIKKKYSVSIIFSYAYFSRFCNKHLYTDLTSCAPFVHHIYNLTYILNNNPSKWLLNFKTITDLFMIL